MKLNNTGKNIPNNMKELPYLVKLSNIKGKLGFTNILNGARIREIS